MSSSLIKALVRECYVRTEFRVDQQPKHLANLGLSRPSDHRCGCSMSTEGFMVIPSAHKQKQLEVVTIDGDTVDRYAKRRPRRRFGRGPCKVVG